MIIVAALVLVGGAAGVLALAHWLRPAVLKKRVHATLLVTTKTGPAFRGLLAEADSDVIVLRNAEAMPEGRGTSVMVDGELILLRSDIAYIQRP